MAQITATPRADEHLHRLYAEFAQLPVGVVTQCAQNHLAVVQAAWLATPGKTWAEQIEAFYESGENCLYELLGSASTRQARLERYEQTGAWSQMLAAGSRVLDFGGGLGLASSLLREAGKEVVYVDVAAPAHEFASWFFAESGLPDIGLATTVPAGGVFDLVLAENVLEYVIDPAGVIEQLAQALAPGGLLFLRFDPRLDTPAEPLRQRIKLDELRRGAPTFAALRQVGGREAGELTLRRG